MVDSADTLAISNTELDVALVSPDYAPGVFDKNVILTVVGSVTNSKDTVIELGSTIY